MRTLDLPGDLGGSHPLASWGNRLLRSVRRRTLLPGLGYKLRESELGVSLEILSAGGGRVAANIVRCRLLSVRANSLKCRRLDTSADVYAAKPFKLRNNITQATIDGLTISYTYDSTMGSVTRFQQRTASAAGYASQIQRVVPRYLTSASTGSGLATDELWLLELSSALWSELSDPDNPSSAAVDVKWVDLNADGRAWAKKP